MKKTLLNTILLTTLFLLSGCNNSSSRSQPYISGSHLDPNNRTNTSVQVVTAKIDSTKEQEIAKINMQKEIEIQRLKNESIIREASIKKELEIQRSNLLKEVEIAKNETQKQMQKENSKMQYWWLFAIASLILVILLFIYLSVRRGRKDKLTIHHEQLEQELHLKEQEMKLKIAEKMLDTLASGNLSEKNEEILINSLSNKDDTKRLKK